VDLAREAAGEVLQLDRGIGTGSTVLEGEIEMDTGSRAWFEVDLDLGVAQVGLPGESNLEVLLAVEQWPTRHEVSQELVETDCTGDEHGRHPLPLGWSVVDSLELRPVGGEPGIE